MIDATARVHQTADLEDDVTVGPATTVWHRAQLRTGVRIGAECIIGRDVFVDHDVTIGDRVKIQNSALLFNGLTVEDAVFIGPGAILTNDRRPRATSGTGELKRAADWTVDPVVLRTGCSIGAAAVVVAGVEVGPYAMVGAGAIVTRDVTGHSLVAGNPARRIGWVCSCGGRLQDAASGKAIGPTPADADLLCSMCGRQFDYLPHSDTLRERSRSTHGVSV